MRHNRILSATLAALASTCALSAAAYAQTVSLTNIAITGDANNFTGLSNPSLSDSGTVGFSGIRSTANGGNGIFTGNGGALTTIAQAVGSNFTSLGSNPSINDSGAVAFVGNRSTANGGNGIFTGNGGALTTIAQTSGSNFTGFGTTPSLNNFGTVAFLGNRSTANGGTGIFLALSGAASPFEVVGVGDSFQSSTITGVNLSATGLNDSNQIAFNYSLQDGRSGVAVASLVAVVVPESGAGYLAAFALPALGFVARRRRK